MEMHKKWVSRWLWVGVVMVFFQVVIGGITRLTGSGLSITEWNLLMGSIPPLSENNWQELFDKYKQFPQYKLMHPDMTISGFKTIFWWEYIHRLWARLFAVVFLVPFVFFVFRKWIDKRLGVKLFLLFLFGAVQGLVGWVMVQSGLVDQPWVNPLKLTLHLILAFMLYAFLINITTNYTIDKTGFSVTHNMKQWLNVFICLIFVQIFFGGLMAGHKAAVFYPTWPLIGNELVPSTLFTFEPAWVNILHNKAMIHFIHRNLAYIIAIAITTWWFIERKRKSSGLCNSLMISLPIAVLLQVLLGILTLLNSTYGIPIVLGVLHQAVALLLLTALLMLRFGAERKYDWKKAAEDYFIAEKTQGL